MNKLAVIILFILAFLIAIYDYLNKPFLNIDEIKSINIEGYKTKPCSTVCGLVNSKKVKCPPFDCVRETCQCPN